MTARRYAARIALTAAIALAAVAALGSAADRMSVTRPEIAGTVPEAFRRHAWRPVALAMLRQGPRAVAVTAAERAVAADPLDSGALAVLSFVRLTLGDAAGSDRAFRVAGALGWRERATQLYWISSALAAGDATVAAERIDALLRQDQTLAQAPQYFAALAARPAGRRALAARLALRPPWLGAYFGNLGELAPDQLVRRAQVLGEPALAPPRVRCAEVRALSAALLTRGEGARGRDIELRFCGARHSAGGLRDGGFDQAQLNGTDPFGWQFVGEGGIDLALSAAPAGSAGQAVTVASSLSARRVFARQTLQLAPGRYRVAWRTRDQGGAPAVLARLTCSPDSGGFVEPSRQAAGRYAGTATVPANCTTQWLELAVAAGASGFVDDVALAPAE